MTFLIAMNQILGRVQVQNNLIGCAFMCANETVDHAPIDLVFMRQNLVVLVWPFLFAQF